MISLGVPPFGGKCDVLRGQRLPVMPSKQCLSSAPSHSPGLSGGKRLSCGSGAQGPFKKFMESRVERKVFLGAENIKTRYIQEISRKVMEKCILGKKSFHEFQVLLH